MASYSSTSDRPGSTLPLELHAATREEHLALNRQILARLPLCLPPHARNAQLYAKGMIVFSQIYFAFERAWNQLLETPNESDRAKALLQILRTTGISRTARLQADMRALKIQLGKDTKQQLDYLEKKSRVFGEAIERAIHARPHVLLAYTWTMYLALFNGGRWMRLQLRNAGDAFWLESRYPLSLWEFDGDDDGESIKLAFKENFAMASADLAVQEMNEVIVESKMLFGMCSEMVKFLDGITVPTPASAQKDSASQSYSWLLFVYFMLLSSLASIWRLFSRATTPWKTIAFPALAQKDILSE